MASAALCALLLACAACACALPSPLHDAESHSLPSLPELSSRVAGVRALAGGAGREGREGREGRARRGGGEARLPLPLPTAQDLDAIRKVAQILAMLGDQVIPAQIGAAPPPAPAPAPAAAIPVLDEPNDNVSD